MAVDAKAYFRRGASTGALTATENAGSANSLAVRAYPNGVPPWQGAFIVVKVPVTGVDGTKNLVCTVVDADDNGSGAPGAFAATAEGATITFTGMVASQRTKYARIHQSREWLGINFVPTAGGNFGNVAAYLTNTQPYYS
jgi:hypothetical protein